MRASNAKLRQRAEVMVGQILGCDAAEAVRHIERADGDVKVAVILGLGLELDEATELLDRHKGHLRNAVSEIRQRIDDSHIPS
jgi:N-acetylmuramic acid 6-phosphate etherase